MREAGTGGGAREGGKRESEERAAAGEVSGVGRGETLWRGGKVAWSKVSEELEGSFEMRTVARGPSDAATKASEPQ